MNIVYKILFEVKLLHEFYLTDKAGKSIFELNLQTDRLAFLKKKFESDAENIDSEITYQAPLLAKKLFDDHHLKLLPAYGGCRVAIEVLPQKLLDGTTVYQPKVALPPDLCIPILVMKNSSRLNSFTNGRMERILNTAYYLSNDSAITGNRVFPSLSTDIPAFDGTASYEQGELLKFGANDYREFYKDDADVVQWISLPTGGFANENDRLIVPLSFYYTFPKGSGVTKADLILKDKNGNQVMDFHFQNDKAYTKILISVDEKKVAVLPIATVTDQLIYTLQVTGDNGYSNVHEIVFYHDEQEIVDSLGLMEIKVEPSAPEYALLDNLGRLITQKKPDGSISPSPPVFEIRLKSKSSFWRYVHNQRKKLKMGLFPDFLINKNGVLITKIPRALTYMATLFRKADNTLHYLPNPEPYQNTSVENNKIYSDIMVQESSLFPLAP